MPSGRKNERRQRNRERRGRRYKGHKAHKTRICPDCKAQIPYVQDVTKAPSTCPKCSHRFECPECNSDLDGDESICPVCDEVLDEDAPDPQEEFTWGE